MSAPFMPIHGLSVSRAYISPEKPRLQASFLFLLGFLLVFWKSESSRLATFAIYSGRAGYGYN